MGRIRIELALSSILLVALMAAVLAVSIAENAWLIAGLGGLIVLMAIRPLFRMWKLTTDALNVMAHMENLPDSPPMSDEQTEALAAVDEFDEAILKAAGIPFADQIRIDRRKLHVLLDRLRTALAHRSFDVAAMVDQLDELVLRAKPVPLTDQVRIDREEIYDVLDQMRASIGTGS